MIYIATNKDNKDSLMHYGVKGMKWGKRGGRRAGEDTIPEDTIPEKIIEEQYIYEDYASNSPKNHHRRPGKGYKTTSRKNNISTSARPKQNKISTSLNARSVPDKRYKQYLRDKAEREKVDERKERYQQEQQRRADREDARKRQQDLKKKRFETKKFHNNLNSIINFNRSFHYKEPGADMWEREHAGEKNPFNYNYRKDPSYLGFRGRKTRRR